MDELRFLAFVCSLPICYPCAKFISRKHLNVFDLLIVFYTTYFCFIPFLSDKSYLDPKIFTSNYLDCGYLYYFIVVVVFLLMDFFYTITSDSKYSLFNITNYICINIYRINKIDIERVKKGIDIVVLFYVLLFCYVFFSNYMENTLIVNFSYEDIRSYYSQKSYNERVISALFNSISPIANSFLVIYIVVCNYYKIKLSFLFKILLSVLFITLLLGSRSYIFFLLIIASIVYYSVNKKRIYVVDIFKFTLVVFTIVYFIFPLVSSIRIIQRMTSFGDFSSNMGLFFNSLISNIIDNHVVLTEFSAESNNARSLSVFSSYMKSFTTSYQIGMGELSLNTFVHALPKILFPFKIFFEDAQILIEKKLGIFTDIGDSIPLFFKMEFNFWGSLFVVPFYCAVVFLWNKIRFVFEHISIDNLFLRYLYLYIILYMCVNVETFIGTYISSIFTYIIIIVVFKFIINRLMNMIVR